MPWHATGMIYEENRVSSLVDNKEGGSLIVWGASCFNGTTDIAFFYGRQTSKDYQNVFKGNLLPIGNNVSIYTSHSTIAWFTQNQLTVIDWPAISPDLNPMENIWGVLAWDVYAHGHQFLTIQELKQQVEQGWFSLEPHFLQNLVQSMPNRFFQCN